MSAAKAAPRTKCDPESANIRYHAIFTISNRSKSVHKIQGDSIVVGPETEPVYHPPLCDFTPANSLAGMQEQLRNHGFTIINDSNMSELGMDGPPIEERALANFGDPDSLGGWRTLGVDGNRGSGKQMMELQNEDYFDLTEPLTTLTQAKASTFLDTHLLLKTGPGAADNQRLHQDMAFSIHHKPSDTPNSSALGNRQYCVWAPVCPEGGVLKIQDHEATEPCYIVVPLGSIIVFDGGFLHAGVSWEYAKEAMETERRGGSMVAIEVPPSLKKKKTSVKIGVCSDGYYFY